MDTSNCFFYPFREQKWPESEQVSNRHQFTGKEWDTDMSLNYFCQRYYDPTIGRFMSLDPERPAASSPYAYCANNPMKYVDPLGLFSVATVICIRGTNFGIYPFVDVIGSSAGGGSGGSYRPAADALGPLSQHAGSAGTDYRESQGRDRFRRAMGEGGPQTGDILGGGRGHHRSATGLLAQGRAAAFGTGKTNERRLTTGSLEVASSVVYQGNVFEHESVLELFAEAADVAFDFYSDQYAETKGVGYLTAGLAVGFFTSKDIDMTLMAVGLGVGGRYVKGPYPAHGDLGPHPHWGPRYPGSSHPKYHFGPENPNFGRGRFTWRDWWKQGRPWRWK